MGVSQTPVIWQAGSVPSAGDAGLTQPGAALLGSLRLGGKLLSQSLGAAQQ